MTLGCWGDKTDRAIPTLEGTSHFLDGNYKKREKKIEKCALAAKAAGYTVFAIQNGGWCASGPSAADDYKKYGTSDACAADGTGGSWANNVYKIEKKWGKQNLQFFE